MYIKSWFASAHALLLYQLHLVKFSISLLCTYMPPKRMIVLLAMSGRLKAVNKERIINNNIKRIHTHIFIRVHDLIHKFHYLQSSQDGILINVGISLQSFILTLCFRLFHLFKIEDDVLAVFLQISLMLTEQPQRGK
jgi:hypothetical protein